MKEDSLTWREKTIIRILMLVAGVIAGNDVSLKQKLDELNNHIQYGRLFDDPKPR